MVQILICCSDNRELCPVVRNSFLQTVEAYGELKSMSSTTIGCPTIMHVWEFTIATMAPEGQQVKKGDLLITFDTKSVAEQLLVKQSELETARKELERIHLAEQEELDVLGLALLQSSVLRQKAKNKAEVSGPHLAMNDVKKNKLDYELACLNEQIARHRVENKKSHMHTQIKFSENKVRKLEKDVADLTESIAKMRVHAPVDGIVVYSPDWRGHKVKVGESVWFGQTIMELPDLSHMEVKAVVPEKDAAQVKQGQSVEVRLDASPDKLFHGRITSLGRFFREKSQEQPLIVFDVAISIDKPDTLLMRPGMTAKANILVASARDVMQIPLNALLDTEDGPQVIKRTLLGTESLVRITTGRRTEGMIEVIDGLEEGDVLVVSHQKPESAASSDQVDTSANSVKEKL